MDNKTKLKELNESIDKVFMEASALMASARLINPEDPKRISLQEAEEGLLNYLSWMKRFIQNEEGIIH